MLLRGSAIGDVKRPASITGHTHLLPTVRSVPGCSIPHYFAQGEKATSSLPDVGQFVIQNSYAEQKKK
jgi:hypothetical protein